ncbi:TrmH family RNA methyltransferase [Eikenella halliae]|uniref:RNA methyltransferase n=1 Tax=Eikenella halliae TaxID=1795832 RepID=A0A1B6VY59_9NEIS|nr:RNA methyltransferase [Eikenella halliae]OAM42234.1 RNA methyltransferase [Eikenella halliae]
MNTIESAQNPALKHLAKLLRSARTRRESGQAVLEGAHLLSAYLQAGGQVLQVYVPVSKMQQPETARLLAQLPPERVVQTAGAALQKITSLTDAEEITALIALPPAEPFDAGADCVVLERIQDPGNIGTILRSAAAAGVGQVVLSADCADAWSPKVLRAGMGAHFALRLFVEPDLAAWRERCRVPLLATALRRNSVNLYDCDLRAPAAWLFGNEGAGVSETMLAAASRLVHIPIAEQTESLNVAMAATVCLFEQMRQRLQQGGD